MADCVKLRKILEYIKELDESQRAETAEEERFVPSIFDAASHGGAVWYQGDWLQLFAGEQHVPSGTLKPEGMVTTVEGQQVKCGTAACFAGWDALLFAPDGTRFHGAAMYLPDGTSVDV